MAQLSRGLAALLGALLAIALILQAVPARAQDRSFTVNQQLALTGLASDANLGVYWAVKDATSSEIVALDSTGGVSGTMTLSASVTDVQALASRAGVLYVADIGDADASRRTVTILRVGEPGFGEVVPRTWTFSYADGPHDAAAFGVSGRGNLYVITRGENPGVYRAEDQPAVGVTNVLTRLGDAPAGVSDMAFLPDGSTMALWGDGGLYLMDGFDLTIDAIAPIARTGQALAIGLEQQVIMLGTGGAQPQVSANQPPTGMTSITPQPSPSPTPTPTPSATVEPTQSVAPTGESSQASRRTGTMAAIAGAAVLAVLAGLATVVLGRSPKRPRRGA